MMSANDKTLFLGPSGPLTSGRITETLAAIGAGDCDWLMIHSEVNFGLPNPELSKRELLRGLFESIAALGVKNLLVPTFTFSFCAREDFDVENSKSPMGAFSEFFRKMPGAVRSADPMLSVAMIGENTEVLAKIGPESCGKGSIFDILHRAGNAKMLFLGKTASSCITHSHYVEVMKGVPYRYPRNFSGFVVSAGRREPKECVLHVRCRGAEPYSDNRLDALALDCGAGKTAALGASSATVVDEARIYEAIWKRLDSDPHFMLSAWPQPPFDETFDYGPRVSL